MAPADDAPSPSRALTPLTVFDTSLPSSNLMTVFVPFSTVLCVPERKEGGERGGGG